MVAILAPVVACNRTQIENGRTYLREIVFGDPDETYSRAARSLVDDTIAAIADAIAMHCHIDAERAGTLANVVIAVLFVSVAMHAIPGVPDQDLTAYRRVHVQAALPS